MRLRGALWHEGSNGLGVGPMWLRRCLPYRQRFRYAAIQHDMAYDSNGDGEYRRFADYAFLAMCLSASDNWLQRLTAWVYFVAVRLFGWLYYRYDN